MQAISPPRTADPPLAAFARDVLRAEANAILAAANLVGERFCEAVALIAACPGNVVVSGVGKSGLIGRKISATLASTGAPSHFLHPTDAMHGDLGSIRAGDVALLLSYSGETEEVLALAAVLRQDGLATIALVSQSDSKLARLATVAVCVGSVEEACPYNLAPTASTTAMLALGDALALAVSRAKSFSANDFHKRHPGGVLGRKMLPLGEVLRHRVGRNVPLVSDDGLVAEALRAASQIPRRCGALLLVDGRGRLTGIFTDADLRRLIIHEGAEALRRPIAQVMTRQPIHLRESDRVIDAIQVIRERRVDEIPIVNAAGEPVGLLDVQDLIALKVISDG